MKAFVLERWESHSAICVDREAVGVFSSLDRAMDSVDGVVWSPIPNGWTGEDAVKGSLEGGYTIRPFDVDKELL